MMTKKKPAPKKTLRVAANSGETEPMAILQNARRERVAQNLAKGMSANASHTAAGYKPNRKNAARMKSYEDIRGRVAELMAPAVEATEATVERVLREMVRLAFYDMTAILESTNGRISMKNPRHLPEDLRRAMTSIKQVQIGDTRMWEVKFADKQKALDSLAR